MIFVLNKGKFTNDFISLKEICNITWHLTLKEKLLLNLQPKLHKNVMNHLTCSKPDSIWRNNVLQVSNSMPFGAVVGVLTKNEWWFRCEKCEEFRGAKGKHILDGKIMVVWNNLDAVFLCCEAPLNLSLIWSLFVVIATKSSWHHDDDSSVNWF